VLIKNDENSAFPNTDQTKRGALKKEPIPLEKIVTYYLMKEDPLTEVIPLRSSILLREI
jgi:hypothetical protein